MKVFFRTPNAWALNSNLGMVRELNSGLISRGGTLSMRTLILTLLLAFTSSAQNHPNFSGTWKQDNSRSTSRPGSTIQYSNKVDHKDPKLSVTTIFGANGDRKESSYTRDYTIGGPATVTNDREGDRFTNT